jgi:hypothetical protein
MRKILTAMILITLPLLVAGSVLYARGFRALQPDQHVPSPTEWIPFRSDFRQVDGSGAVHVGRFYRRSDGSTRSESGQSLGKWHTILIKNISTATYYTWYEERGWARQPMQLPKWGWRPGKRHFNTPGLTLVPQRVEGFTLLKVEHNGGAYDLQAPELNFFTVVRHWGDTVGSGTTHSNIRVGEQPAELFEPPRDASVAAIGEPGGIVRKSPQ